MRKFFANKPNIVLILLMTLFAFFGTVFCALETPIAFAEEQTVKVQQSGPRLIADDGSSYAWLCADAADGEYTAIVGNTSKYYDIKADDAGKYF